LRQSPWRGEPPEECGLPKAQNDGELRGMHVSKGGITHKVAFLQSPPKRDRNSGRFRQVQARGSIDYSSQSPRLKRTKAAIPPSIYAVICFE